jgi:hypothetical protein
VRSVDALLRQPAFSLFAPSSTSLPSGVIMAKINKSDNVHHLGLSQSKASVLRQSWIILDTVVFDSVPVHLPPTIQQKLTACTSPSSQIIIIHPSLATTRDRKNYLVLQKSHFLPSIWPTLLVSARLFVITTYLQQIVSSHVSLLGFCFLLPKSTSTCHSHSCRRSTSSSSNNKTSSTTRQQQQQV